MPPRPRSPHRLRQLCAEVSPEDGVDPRDWIKAGQVRKPGHRKAYQLCGQVADALRLLLADQADDRLAGLDVAEVTPAPDTSRLLVTVRETTAGRPGPVEILDALENASGRLRAGVAAAITRRKAPHLAFRLVAVGRD